LVSWGGNQPLNNKIQNFMRLHLIKFHRHAAFIALLVIVLPTGLQALEFSGAITFPSGGIINSLYLSGTPIDGITLKIKSHKPRTKSKACSCLLC